MQIYTGKPEQRACQWWRLGRGVDLMHKESGGNLVVGVGCCYLDRTPLNSKIVYSIDKPNNFKILQFIDFKYVIKLNHIDTVFISNNKNDKLTILDINIHCNFVKY